MKTVELTNSNFKDKINSAELVVVDFWAAWCGPCRRIAPELDKLAEANDDIVVGKLNVDENSNTAAIYAIRSIPTIMIFKNGEKVTQFGGVKSASELQKIVDEYK